MSTRPVPSGPRVALGLAVLYVLVNVLVFFIALTAYVDSTRGTVPKLAYLFPAIFVAKWATEPVDGIEAELGR